MIIDLCGVGVCLDLIGQSCVPLMWMGEEEEEGEGGNAMIGVWMCGLVADLGRLMRLD